MTGIGKHKIVKIGCGDFHSAALNEKGELYTWGGGGSHFNKGQCGHGTFNDSENPDTVVGMKGRRILDFACGGYHTLCIVEETENTNSVYSWGSGYYGQLGNKEVSSAQTDGRQSHRGRGLGAWSQEPGPEHQARGPPRQ